MWHLGCMHYSVGVEADRKWGEVSKTAKLANSAKLENWKFSKQENWKFSKSGNLTKLENWKFKKSQNLSQEQRSGNPMWLHCQFQEHRNQESNGVVLSPRHSTNLEWPFLYTHCFDSKGLYAGLKRVCKYVISPHSWDPCYYYAKLQTLLLEYCLAP